MKGFLMTAFCNSEVDSFEDASFLSNSSLDMTSTGGKPLHWGVSWRKRIITTTPAAPAKEAPTNPHYQPKKPTTAPTNIKERNSPKLWLALKNP